MNTAAHQPWMDSQWFATWLALARHVAVLCAFVWGVAAREYYVSPTGKSTSDGSTCRPWSLQYALTNALVSPGDTIWVRGGTYLTSFGESGMEYVSRLGGTIAKPIQVKAYGSERPIIKATALTDRCLYVWGSNTWFRGLEFWNSSTNAGYRAAGLMLRGPRTKLINCIVHDVGVGVYVGEEAVDSELTGNLCYNCGDNVDAQKHGIYAHSTSTLILKDNITLNNSHYGIHCYSEVTGELKGISLIGNISANNGSIIGGKYPNFLLGGFGDTVVADNATVALNMGYHPTGYNLLLGYMTYPNGSAVVSSNYFSGGGSTVNYWTNLTLTANSFLNESTFLSYNPGAGSSATWNNNTYYPGYFKLSEVGISYADWKTATGFDASSTVLGANPDVTQVFVRPNSYQSGRASVSIFNWATNDNVSVDVSSALRVGQKYEVRNAFNWNAAAVKSGTYAGGSISLPMTNLTVAVPVGSGLTTPASTGPGFAAFVVIPK